MMYQRDMAFLNSNSSPLPRWEEGKGGRLLFGEQAEEEADCGREESVDAEEEQSEHGGHDHHHDCGGDGLLAGRPVDSLDRFQADLADEFAGGGFGHVSVRFMLLRIEKRPTGRPILWAASGAGWSLSGGGPSLQG